MVSTKIITRTAGRFSQVTGSPDLLFQWTPPGIAVLPQTSTIRNQIPGIERIMVVKNRSSNICPFPFCVNIQNGGAVDIDCREVRNGINLSGKGIAAGLNDTIEEGF